MRNLFESHIKSKHKVLRKQYDVMKAMAYNPQSTLLFCFFTSGICIVISFFVGHKFVIAGFLNHQELYCRLFFQFPNCLVNKLVFVENSHYVCGESNMQER